MKPGVLMETVVWAVSELHKYLSHLSSLIGFVSFPCGGRGGLSYNIHLQFCLDEFPLQGEQHGALSFSVFLNPAPPHGPDSQLTDFVNGSDGQGGT